MKQINTFIAFSALFSATAVMSMSTWDYGKFLYIISGNYTTVLINRPPTYVYTELSGYESLRPIQSIPALQTSASYNDRFFYSQHANRLNIPNISNNGVLRVSFKNNRDAVFTHRNFKEKFKVPTTDEEGFQKFFRGLTANVFQSADEACRHVFDYIPYRNEFRGRSQGCTIYVEMHFTCNQRRLTEFGGWRNIKGHYSYMLTANIAKRYTVPASWNAHPC